MKLEKSSKKSIDGTWIKENETKEGPYYEENHKEKQDNLTKKPIRERVQEMLDRCSAETGIKLDERDELTKLEEMLKEAEETERMMAELDKEMEGLEKDVEEAFV